MTRFKYFLNIEFSDRVLNISLLRIHTQLSNMHEVYEMNKKNILKEDMR